MLFHLGNIYITPGALEVLGEAGQSPDEFLVRHVNGDWGDLCEEDKQENKYALEHGFRVFSAYFTKTRKKIWVITEADRSMTTILLPEEY